MDVPLYQEAVYHYLSGIAISLGDRMLSKNAKKNTQARMQGKLEQAEALNYLFRAQQQGTLPELEQAPEFRQAIRRANEYFTDQGIHLKPSQGARKVLGIAERVISYRNRERINTRTLTGKLRLAFGLELTADALVGLAQIVAGKGNALGALYETLYQGPALGMGFATGKGILLLNDAVRRSKEEKELDKTLRDLVEDGKLLQLVRGYVGKPKDETPEQSQQPELPAETRTEQLIKIGSGLVGKIGEARTKIAQRVEERRKRKIAEEEARQEELRRRYKDY